MWRLILLLASGRSLLRFQCRISRCSLLLCWYINKVSSWDQELFCISNFTTLSFFSLLFLFLSFFLDFFLLNLSLLCLYITFPLLFPHLFNLFSPLSLSLPLQSVVKCNSSKIQRHQSAIIDNLEIIFGLDLDKSLSFIRRMIFEKKMWEKSEKEKGRWGWERHRKRREKRGGKKRWSKFDLKD